jgi:uncharacterized protein (DUF1330 family)
MTADAHPLTLVIVDYNRAHQSSATLKDDIALMGGELLIDAIEPIRVYEYILPLPSRLIISQWQSIEPLRGFLKSELYGEIHAALGPHHAVVIYKPGFDWDPTRPGLWIEPEKPAVISPGPVFHVTFSEVTAPEKLPFAEAAGNLINFYPRWGGFPLINRSPIETVSGHWPENRNLLITRWPCQEAFEAWYLDEPYQKNVKPRRLVCGRFSLMMFRCVL